VTTQPPIIWCDENPFPLTVIGDFYANNQDISASVMIETTGNVSVAGRVSSSTCGSDGYISGVFFTINNEGNWLLMSYNDTVSKGYYANFTSGTWHTLRLQLQEETLIGSIDGNVIAKEIAPNSNINGFAALGSSWDYVQFDDFELLLQKSQIEPLQEEPVSHQLS